MAKKSPIQIMDGLYINPEFPEEYIDLRYLNDGGETAVSMHVRLFDYDYRYATAFKVVTGAEKEMNFVLQRIEKDELSSWGNIWWYPVSPDKIAATMVANPFYRPYAEFTRVVGYEKRG